VSEVDRDQSRVRLLTAFRARLDADGISAFGEGARFAFDAIERETTHLFQRSRFGALGRGSAVLRPRLLSHPRFMRIGTGVVIRPGARLEAIRHYAGRTFQPLLTIGDRTRAEFDLQVECAESVQIGADVLIAGRVFISDLDHGFGDRGVHPLSAPITTAPVMIGDGSWLGQNVCILSGVTLGVGCVVAAGAVVTKSFGDYSIVGGVPARLIKTRH
jgi:acetyltransferase-like isoleucine patch superfamily enzyme